MPLSLDQSVPETGEEGDNHVAEDSNVEQIEKEPPKGPQPTRVPLGKTKNVGQLGLAKVPNLTC